MAQGLCSLAKQANAMSGYCDEGKEQKKGERNEP